MSSEVRRVVLDVNVILDNYLPGRVNAAASRALIDRCRFEGIEMLYSAASVQNVFYVIVSSLKRAARLEERELGANGSRAIHQMAWACVDNLNELGTPIGLDGSDLWVAGKCRKLHPDLEDDLVVAACKRVNADYLATNDQVLLKRSPVPALAPASLLALLETE